MELTLGVIETVYLFVTEHGSNYAQLRDKEELQPHDDGGHPPVRDHLGEVVDKSRIHQR